MIYRLLIDEPDPNQALLFDFFQRVGGCLPPFPWATKVERRLAGGSYGPLAIVMAKRGLRAPHITNRRARFYFTQRGWHKIGRHVAAEAARLGHVVKVIRRKEPEHSQVIYRDALQIAVLPRKESRTRRLSRTKR